MKAEQHSIGLPLDLLDRVRAHQKRMADRDGRNVSLSAAVVAVLAVGMKEIERRR
jgi:hypothetical protein